MEENVIKIDHLTKDFGHGRGVFDVSFGVNEGECFGYLGPNGAGKSTTIRMLMGFTRPQKGSALIHGGEVIKDRASVMQGVCYVPGEIAMPPMLTGYDVLKIQMQLKGVKDDAEMKRLMGLFQLDPALRCREMSLGMRRKLVIVSAFLSSPDVIILDEPSSGLDPEMQKVFIELIRQKKKEGKTILLSSHIFGEVDALADRIAIIKDGHIVSFFKADELKHKTLKTYCLSFSSANEKERFLKQSGVDYRILDPNLGEKDALVTIDDSKITEALREITPFLLTDFSEKKETLEDYFMSFYKEERTYQGL